MADLESLAQANYVQLVTFRRDGRAVATPVWCVVDADRLCFYTQRNAGKAKRIRASGRVRLAACNGTGGVILGPWYEGTGRQVEDARRAQAIMSLMGRKYGWQFGLLTLVAVLARNRRLRVVFEIDCHLAQF